jgi:bifunctional enzyme CysN/CysC
MTRDPKGIYRKAREGSAEAVPGLQVAYEPPEDPDLIVRGDRETPEAAAQQVIAKLFEREFIVA